MTSLSHPHRVRHAAGTAQERLDHRLDDVFWGVFLIMTGSLLLAGEFVSWGMWLAGTGLLLLALAGIRFRKGLPVGTVSIILGVVALLSGIAEIARLQVPLPAIAVVVIGVLLLAKPLFDRHT